MDTDVLKKGRLVKSLSGRDKGYILAVVAADEKTVFVCDGKERPLSKPKKKNIRHIEVLDCVLEEENMLTDRALRRAINRIKTENSSI